MPNQQLTRGVRTGGRSARVQEAVLTAAFGELIDHGYAALSVEAIASRAQVNKTTVYRRWATLDDLVVDALTRWSEEAIPAPDTGSIETDLLAHGGVLAEILNAGEGRQITAMVLATGLQSSRLRETTQRYFDHQSQRAKPIIDRAIERGELPADTDTEALIATFRAPFFCRVVTTGDPIDDALIKHATRVTLAAAHAGVLSAAESSSDQ